MITVLRNRFSSTRRPQKRVFHVISGVFASLSDAYEAHDANRKHLNAIGGRVVRVQQLWLWEVVFEVSMAPVGTEPELVGLLPEDLKLYGIAQ